MWFFDIEPICRDMDWGEPKTIPYENYPYHVSIRKGHEPDVRRDRRKGNEYIRTIDLTDYHKWAKRHGLDMRHSLIIHGEDENYKHLVCFFFRKKSEAIFFKLAFHKNEGHRN